MKQRLTLFLFLLSLSMGAQTIFVKAGAVGTNDGTTWANAFTSLDAAVTAAVAGQSIWVAAGTYKPLTPAPNNSFVVAGGVKMYGGFSGSETTLAGRNIAANPTILSGDILGNDVAGDSLSLIDNSIHVVVAAVLVDNPGTVIDGFTITKGRTKVGAAFSDLTRRGGGLLAVAKTTVRNCTFTANYGDSGAALAALDALSNGTVIDNCVFNANTATASGVCFLRNTANATVKNCSFTSNITNRGALYPSATTALVIDSCLFQGNDAGVNYGGGMFTYQAKYTISNSTFKNNTAANAAGIYADGRDLNSTFIINKCTFEGNTATNYGGTALFCNVANYTMNNCIIQNNTAPSSGAAIYHGGACVFTIKGCVIKGNNSAYAGAVANYNTGGIGTFEDCSFENNTATSGGGACSNGFKANVLYKNCDFISNTANFGGAIFTQNDTTRLRVDGCYFFDNTAAGTSGTAGCILVNTGIAASIKNSSFSTNVGASGGAISANGDSLIIIDKCSFTENVATTQGGAINFSDAKSILTNCLFAKNVNAGTGAGGAIICNAADDKQSNVKAVNCTFADNYAGLGAGIAQWEGPLGDGKLTLQNCLFQNTDGDNYGIEEGEPEVISLGGNQSSDATLEIYLTATKDMNSVTNDFPNAGGNDYAHTIDSPAADGGVSAGAPADDINGVSRAGIPDVGCYEVKTSSVRNPGLQVLSLQCIPNPAIDQTMISLKNERTGMVQVSVWNQLGQQVASHYTEKTGNEFLFPLNVSQLAAGTYKVQVRSGALVHEGAFVKF